MNQSSQITTAVILAGGEGRRLYPLTAHIPKPLVQIGNKSVIEHLLGCLSRYGIDDVHLAIGNQSDRFKTVLGSGEQFGMRLSYHIEKSPLSTIGPLTLIDSLSDTFFVLNGDIITNLDFHKLSASHVESKAILTVVVCPRTECIDYGVVESNSSNHVTGFIEKPSYSYLVSAGIYCMSKRILSYIPHGQQCGFDDLMKILLANNEHVNAFRFDGYWLDIGRPDDYDRACREIDSISLNP